MTAELLEGVIAILRQEAKQYAILGCPDQAERLEKAGHFVRDVMKESQELARQNTALRETAERTLKIAHTAGEKQREADILLIAANRELATTKTALDYASKECTLLYVRLDKLEVEMEQQRAERERVSGRICQVLGSAMDVPVGEYTAIDMAAMAASNIARLETEFQYYFALAGTAHDHKIRTEQLYREQYDRAEKAIDCLGDVMGWVENWNPPFENDPDWPAVRDRANHMVKRGGE